MESCKDYFSWCRTTLDVHNELITLLVCDFLKPEDTSLRFRMNCRSDVTPAVRETASIERYLNYLEEKGEFREGHYDFIKQKVEKINVAITDLIIQAERKIEEIRENSLKVETIVTDVEPTSLEEETRSKVTAILLSVSEILICKSNDSNIEIRGLWERYRDYQALSYNFLSIWHTEYCRCQKRYGQQMLLQFLRSGAAKLESGQKEYDFFRSEVVPSLWLTLKESVKCTCDIMQQYGASPVSVARSSVLSYWIFDSIINLDTLWRTYEEGGLHAELQDCFNTEEALRLLKVDRISLKMTILKSDYLKYRSILAKISDQGATAFPVQTMVECGICGGIFNVDWFCKTCSGSLCDTCYQTHQRASLLRNHIVVPRTVEVLRLHGPAKIAEICRIHPTKDISTYCNDCKIPCCVLCHHEKHKRHEFSPIEDKYLSAEKSLDQYTRELQTDVKPSLDALKDSLKHHLKKHDEQIEKEKDEINTLRYTLKQKVDESCDLLLKELDQAKQDFRNFEKEIDSSKQRLDQLIKDLEIMIGEGKLDIIEYSPPTRKSLIPASPLPVLKVPKFVPGRDLIGLIQNKIGRIEFHDQISDNEETNASSNTALDIDISEQKSLIQVKGIDKADIKVTKVKSFKSKIRVTSLTSAGTCNNSAWVMNDGSNTMYLYDSNGLVVRSIKVKNSQGISDIVITRSGDMIVTCKDKTVRRVSVGGEVSILINPGDYTPNGVCLTDKEEIVVCMYSIGRVHVAVYSPDGRSKLREIRGVDSQGNPQIISPYRVVCNDEDLCVVDDSNVVCVDESYNVKWVYDGKQANLRISFYPLCICVDKYHNLLVTDYNNDCVHYIDREGGLIQVIMTQEQTGLVWPWGICVDDETGQVWVGNEYGDVVIAKYLK